LSGKHQGWCLPHQEKIKIDEHGQYLETVTEGDLLRKLVLTPEYPLCSSERLLLLGRRLEFVGVVVGSFSA
jgi:hypothetical protein